MSASTRTIDAIGGMLRERPTPWILRMTRYVFKVLGKVEINSMPSEMAPTDEHPAVMNRYELLAIVQPRSSLLDQIEALGRGFLWTNRCSEARRILEAYRSSEPWVVLADVRLPDGTWRDILTYVIQAGIHAEVVVIANECDKELWLEAPALGVFDLLAPPYSRERTRQVIEAAAASCEKYPYSI